MLAALLGEEGIHGRQWDAPITAVQLVRTLEAAMLAPLADGRRRAMKSRRHFGHCEVRLGSVGRGLAAIRRKFQEPVPGERQGGPRREALSQLAEAVGKIHRPGPPPCPNPSWRRPEGSSTIDHGREPSPILKYCAIWPSVPRMTRDAPLYLEIVLHGAQRVSLDRYRGPSPGQRRGPPPLAPPARIGGCGG